MEKVTGFEADYTVELSSLCQIFWLKAVTWTAFIFRLWKLLYINAQVTPRPPKYHLPSRRRTRRLLCANDFAASVSRKSVFGSERYAPTHSLCGAKAALWKRARSIRHPQPQAILHLADLRWQTVAWVSTCLLYRRIILLSYVAQIWSPTIQTEFWAL